MLLLPAPTHSIGGHRGSKMYMFIYLYTYICIHLYIYILGGTGDQRCIYSYLYIYIFRGTGDQINHIWQRCIFISRWIIVKELVLLLYWNYHLVLPFFTQHKRRGGTVGLRFGIARISFGWELKRSIKRYRCRRGYEVQNVCSIVSPRVFKS